MDRQTETKGEEAHTHTHAHIGLRIFCTVTHAGVLGTGGAVQPAQPNDTGDTAGGGYADAVKGGRAMAQGRAVSVLPPHGWGHVEGGAPGRGGEKGRP